MSYDRETMPLAELESAVVTDPGIMGGEPVLTGTRMPVFMVADMRRAGMSIEAILKEYPSLSPELVELAEAYVVTHAPLRQAQPAWRNQPPLGMSFVSRGLRSKH